MRAVKFDPKTGVLPLLRPGALRHRAGNRACWLLHVDSQCQQRRQLGSAQSLQCTVAAVHSHCTVTAAHRRCSARSLDWHRTGTAQALHNHCSSHCTVTGTALARHCTAQSLHRHFTQAAQALRRHCPGTTHTLRRLCTQALHRRCTGTATGTATVTVRSLYGPCTVTTQCKGLQSP